MDLIAIETIRVFAPALYNVLPDAKHILTDHPRFMRKEEKKQDAAELETLFSLVPEGDREAARNVIKELFPPAASVLAGSHYSGHGSDNWFPDLRIASHEVFDRYFHFATPPGDLAQAELDEVIALVGNHGALGAKLKNLESRKLLDVLLDRLDSYKEKLPLEHVLPCITTLFDLEVNGDDELLAAHFSPRTHIKRIVHWYLRRLPDQATRKQTLLNAIEQTAGLMTPISMAAWLNTKATDAQPSDPDALLENALDIKEVRDAAVAKIRAAANSGRLANEKEMGFLIGVWNAWGPPDEAKKWISQFAQSDSGLLRFLAMMRNTSRSYGGPIPRDHHYYKLSNIEVFFPVEDVWKRIEALDLKALSEEDGKNVVLFTKALERKKQGLGELDFMSADE